MWIELDGHMQEARAPHIDALAPGRVQGKGVFETFWVQAGLPIVAFARHWQRWQRGIRALEMAPVWKDTQVLARIQELLRRNHLTCARVRLSVWQAPDTPQQHQAIVVQPLRQGPLTGPCPPSINVMIATRLRPLTRWSHLKSLDYACFHQAWVDAQAQGYDEAILLNCRGHLVEASRANLFWVRQGRLYTPAVREGCLNGVTRKIVLSAARSLGLACQRVGEPARSLMTAQEAFVTNAVRGIVPIGTIDQRTLGPGQVGPITQRLREAYRQGARAA